MKQNRNIVRLNESQLRQMIAESVKRVLSEKKLENSFDSEEDMTMYRDMYAPENVRLWTDAEGTVHDWTSAERIAHGASTDGGGKWGSGPYRPYIHHDYAEEFISKYINDDHADMYRSGRDNEEENEHNAKYNDDLRKRLATKGGQMSYDWDEEQKMNQWDDNARRGLLNLVKQKRDQDRRDELINGRFMMNKWLNGEINDDDLKNSHKGVGSKRKYHSIRNESRIHQIVSESIDRVLKNM